VLGVIKLNEEIFLKYCIENLDLSKPDEFNNYFSSVPICVINSIYSINTKYEAVLNVIDRYSKYYDIKPTYSVIGRIPPKEKQRSVSEVYDLFKDNSYKFLAEKVFKNKQRTSTKNGILKSEAVVRFLKILKDFRIEYYQDVPLLFQNGTFEDCIKRIPGQKSGISLKYFFMLTGSKNLIKPDRMVLSFIKDATNLKLSKSEALTLIKKTVKSLKKSGYINLTARHLDNLIWNYQR